MEMASPVHVQIPPYQEPLRLKKDNTQTEHQRVTVLVITGIVGFVLAVLIAFSFGA